MIWPSDNVKVEVCWVECNLYSWNAKNTFSAFNSQILNIFISYERRWLRNGKLHFWWFLFNKQFLQHILRCFSVWIFVLSEHHLFHNEMNGPFENDPAQNEMSIEVNFRAKSKWHLSGFVSSSFNHVYGICVCFFNFRYCVNKFSLTIRLRLASGLLSCLQATWCLFNLQRTLFWQNMRLKRAMNIYFM